MELRRRALLICAFVLWSIDFPSANAADYKLSAKPMGDSKRADKVEVRSCNNDKAEVEITRQFGIGGSTFNFEGSQLPKRLELHFKKFDNLESFGLICGTKRISTSLKMAPKSHESMEIPTGANFKSSKKNQDGLDVRMKMDKDHIKVEIPCQTFMGTNRSLTISWVDWYRH